MVMTPKATKHTSNSTMSIPTQCACGRLTLSIVGLILTAYAMTAEGLRVIPPSAFGLDRSGARFAQVEDASAVWHNPANLVNLTNAQLEFAPSAIHLKVDYDSPTGTSVETKNPWKFLLGGFGSVPFKDGKYALGVGLTMPYGLSVEWDDSPTSPFHYTAPYYSKLTTININPTFAARVLDNLSIGVGIDAMWSELDLRQYYPWLAFPGSGGTEPDGDARLKGDGWGLGANIALTWEFIPNHRLAATYRSQQTVTYKGSFTIDNITPTAAGLGATSSSSFGSEIGFPNTVGLGYGIRLSDKVRLEVNGEWLQWSRFQSLDLDIGNNSFLLPSTQIPQDWSDTFTVGIGGDYRFNQHFAVRGGYQFYQSPVPDEAYSPTIPDADQHVFTVGFAYNSAHHAVELAYGLDLYDKREITTAVNPAFNGTYDVLAHFITLSYRYTF